ncbi:MAG: LamG domain-containing protein, partial [Candidatus Aureabacteria bacterium]|nr:LamG domain-containing protein [Candidatus Auribacterota bacterium]
MEGAHVTDPHTVGLWHFNEGGGGTAGDSSGGGHEGTLRDSAGWTGAGRLGGAIHLGGPPSCVVVPSHDDLDLTDAISVEAWVKMETYANWMRIVSKNYWDGSRERGSWYLRLDNQGRVQFALLEPWQGVTSPGRLPLNYWTHLAGTFDGSTIRLYINGRLVASGNYPRGINVSALPVGIGCSVRPDGSVHDCFRGYVDEVGISDIARDDFRPSCDMAMDSTVRGNDGLNWGAARGDTGVSGAAYRFDGVDDYIEIPDSGSLDLTGGITLEAWINPGLVNGARRI